MKEPTRQFLADVLIAAMEGGINYWVNRVVSYKVDLVTGVPLPFPIALIEVENARTGELQTLSISEDVLRRGLRRIENEQVKMNSRLRQSILNAVEDDDAGQVDAEMADAIVQVGLLDEIVYG